MCCTMWCLMSQSVLTGQPPGDGGEPETVITSTRTDPFFYSLITPFQMMRVSTLLPHKCGRASGPQSALHM